MKLNRRLFRFQGRIDALVRIIGEFDHGGRLTGAQKYIVERALLQLQIEWELFVRNLILDSATGQYTDSNGKVVSKLGIPAPTRERASHVLISRYKRRRREPDWYLPKDAIQAANLLAVTNLQNIAAWLGLSPWEIEELRYIRNFIAHQSKESALEVRRRGLLPSSGRINTVATAYAFDMSGMKNYLRWSRFMKLVAGKLTG